MHGIFDNCLGNAPCSCLSAGTAEGASSHGSDSIFQSQTNRSASSTDSIGSPVTHCVEWRIKVVASEVSGPVAYRKP